MTGPDTRPIAAAELPVLFKALAAYDHLVLAISGGADSTALMHLIADWQERVPAPKRVGIHVISIDHGLRPQAAQEARTVVAMAAKLGLPGEVLTWTGAIPKSAIQESARQIRYELLFERARELTSDGDTVALVTAHHRDDLAETVIMRLARGAGVDGLAAIMPAVHHMSGIAILRPLLETPKTRLRATLEARGQSWIEDPSNHNQRFERVRLRQASEARAALGLSNAALALTATRMSRARLALEGMVDKCIASHLGTTLLQRCGVFEWPWLPGQIPDEIAIRALSRVLRLVGGHTERLRLQRVERLFEQLHDANFAGATLGNCIITPQPARNGLPARKLIYREPDRGSLPDITVDLAEPVVWDNRFALTSSVRMTVTIRVRPFVRDDLNAYERAIEPGLLACPIDALRATPVVEQRGRLLWIPALDMHDSLNLPQFPAVLGCRFLVAPHGTP